MEKRDCIEQILVGEGYKLTTEQLHQVDLFIEELSRWNSKINLTRVTNLEDIVRLHFADSFRLIKYLTGREKVLDIGSGAGIPGLILKIVLPGLDLVSVEKVGKKQIFQKQTAAKLQLSDVVVEKERIEILAEKVKYQGAFDVVVSRAWTELTGFADQAKVFLKKDGMILAMTSRMSDAEEDVLAEQLLNLGYQVEKQERYKLAGANKEHMIRLLRLL